MRLTPLFRPVETAKKPPKALSLLGFLTRLIWLCVLPLVLLAIYLAVNHVQTLQVQLDDEARDQVRNAATAIDRQITAQIAALQVLGASPLVDDPPRLNEFYSEARAFRESFGGHVILADLSMQMLFNTREPFGAPLPKLPKPRGHAAAPAVLETGNPAVGDMFLGRIAKEPLVAVVVPVLRDGQMRFLLLSIIETRQFQQRLDDVSLPSGWSMTVLDGKAEVIAHRSSPEMQGQLVGGESPRRFDAKSTVSHWSVLLEIPGSVYRAPIIAATAALVMAILAVTFVSVLGGWLAARGLSRSVAAIGKTSSRLASRPMIAEIEAIRQTLIQAGTAREAAESTLRESEEKFSKAFQNSPDAITITAVADGRLVEVNEALTRLSGYSREETIGRTSMELDLWANPAGRDHYVAKLIEKGRVLNLDADFKTKSGEIRTCLVSGEFVEIQGVPHILGVIRDITERKRGEEALRASEERFRRAVIESPFPIILHAEGGEVLQISRSWSEITGYAPEEIPTISDWTERAYGERKEFVRADIERLCALDRHIGEGDYTIRTKDGATRVWNFSSAPLGRLPDGRRLVISMAMDVTELKRSEEERQKFVMLAESSGEFIGMCDLDLQPLYVNPAGVRMVGLPDMAAACRVKVQDYFFLEDQPFITEEFFPRVMREGHGVVEIRLRHFRTGEPVWMSYYLFHLRDASGTVVGWATVSRDITERKKAQEEIYRLNAELEQRVLERTAQLEEANRDLESFSYSVSHDLRAPLRAISGFAEIIARRHRASLNDEGQRYFDSIVEASAQMGRLIDDLLRYSRLERRAVQLQTINPLAVLGKAIKTLTERIAESGAEIAIPEDMPVAYGDATLLEQIFTNLLGNALTYRRSEGTPRIQIGATVRHGYVVIEVSDNGIGIAPEYQEKIFNMFQRLHSYEEYPGTGIGLAIVRKSANLMNGQVWVESELGHGSRFFVKLIQAKMPAGTE